MARYTVNLRGYSKTVDVPQNVKGIEPVSEYITQYLGDEYARAMVRRYPTKYPNPAVSIPRLTENWYDTHLPFILSEIQALARDTVEELRE